MNDPKNYEKIILNFKKSGVKNLHVLADFDRTFTYGSINGEKTPSIISMLRDGKHLSEDYAEKANSFYEKYAPMENDPRLTLFERKEKMKEWWDTHHKVLIESKLSI